MVYGYPNDMRNTDDTRTNDTVNPIDTSTLLGPPLPLEAAPVPWAPHPNDTGHPPQCHEGRGPMPQPLSFALYHARHTVANARAY